MRGCRGEEGEHEGLQETVEQVSDCCDRKSDCRMTARMRTEEPRTSSTTLLYPSCTSLAATHLLHDTLLYPSCTS